MKFRLKEAILTLLLSLGIFLPATEALAHTCQCLDNYNCNQANLSCIVQPSFEKTHIATNVAEAFQRFGNLGDKPRNTYIILNGAPAEIEVKQKKIQVNDYYLFIKLLTDAAEQITPPPPSHQGRDNRKEVKRGLTATFSGVSCFNTKGTKSCSKPDKRTVKLCFDPKVGSRRYFHLGDANEVCDVN